MYQCEECKKVFNIKSNLTRHQKNVHSKLFKCDHCKAKFATEQERNEHELNKHQIMNCQVCDYKTTKENYLMKHYDTKHRPSYKRKQEDNEDISEKKIKYDEEIQAPPPAPPPPPPPPPPPVPPPQGRYRNILSRHTFTPNQSCDLLKTQAFYKKIFKIQLKRKFLSFGQIKFKVCFAVELKKFNKENTEVYTTNFTWSNTHIILHEGEIEEKINLCQQKIARRVEEFIQDGSGWVYDRTSKIDLHVYKYQPQRGGGNVPLEEWIAKSKSVVNIKTNDDQCFLYSVQAARMYEDGRVTQNFHRASNYKKYLHELDYKGIPMPMSLEDIPKFEKRNNLAINVYGLKEKRVVPLQCTKIPTNKIIKLLFLEENGNCHYTWIKNFDRLLHLEGSDRRYHCPFCLHGFAEKHTCEEHHDYCRKKDPVKVQFPKNTNLKFKDHKNMLKAPFTIYADFESCIVKENKAAGDKSEITSVHKPCGFCLVITSPYFPRREISYRGKDAETKFIEELKKARNECLNLIKNESHKPMLLTSAEEQAFMSANTCWICEGKGFTESRKTASTQNRTNQKHLKVLRPFLGECDMDMGKIPTIAEVKKLKRIQMLQLHPDKNSNLDPKVKKEKEEKLKKRITAFKSIMKHLEKHKLSVGVVERDEWDELIDDDEMPKYKSKIRRDYRKVRDHDHFTGKFRGAAHSKCNIKLQVRRENVKIPIFFHNLQKYDGHIIVNGLADLAELDEEGVLVIKGRNDPKIEVIAKSMDQFLQIRLGKHLVIRDSLSFLPYSLEKLVKDRKSAPKTTLPKLFPNLFASFKENYPHLPEHAFNLLTNKLPYPYSYMDSHDKFDEKKLPPKHVYKNDLTGEDISEKEYNFAKKIWDTFQLKSLGELHDLYVSTDTNLLADVFDGFRDLAYDSYKLDPAHYVTLPSYSWSAALKITKVNLELINDIDMSLFIDQVILGGYAAVVEHYAKANNKYLEDYEPEKATSYIFSTDCTNEYGAAMKKFLPKDGFKWVDDVSKFTEEYIKNLQPDQPIGFFIEADIEYPKHLHDAHNSFPLGPEKTNIKKDMLSDYQNQLSEKLGIKPGGEKVCLTLNDKKNYHCHYLQLKQMLEMGLKLKKVHRVIQFNQSPWLQPYIDMNTEQRREAQKDGNKCLESLFKLMNNAFFGKV